MGTLTLYQYSCINVCWEFIVGVFGIYINTITTNIINSSENVDLLGLIIDSKLNFSKHIQTTTQKASLKLIALRRLSKWLDPEVRLDYGQTFVLSKFSYCPLVWHFCSRHDVLIMENVQKRLLRNIYEDYESSYDELLLKAS